MKRVFLSLFLVVTTSLAANAFDYNDARNQAWFLTDKMAYELNLTPEQYDVAYQVNLEYFMNIHSAADCYGRYWNYRNADLRYILFDWQYQLFTTLDYFYRPIHWIRTGWRFPIFDRYRKGYYYYKRPVAYLSYSGGLWKHRNHRDASPYKGKSFRKGPGMRDHYDGKRPGRKPDYRPEFGKTGKDKNNNRYDNNRYDKPKGNDRGQNKPNVDNKKKDPTTARPGNDRRTDNRVSGNKSTRRETTTTRPSTHQRGGSATKGGNNGTRSNNSNKSSNSGRSFGR